MPIKRIFWDVNTGQYIHVLRGGVTRDPTLGLKFVQDDAAGTVHFARDYLNQFADVTLTFTPLFKGTAQGSEFIGHQNGITVSRTAGVVRVNAAIGINVKHNFIIEVEARNVGREGTFREAIRVHVHASVTQVWLTPDQLTVRPTNGPGEQIVSTYRFAVRAQFDDGLVGDLTDGHGVTWSEPGGHVNASDGRILLLAGDRPGDTFPVRATLPSSLGGASTPAGPSIRIESALSAQATPPRMTRVAGGGLPSAATVEDSLNVLLVSSGFKDKGAFDRIVARLVHHLTTNKLTKPFDLLSGRMRFWKLFLAAEGVGTSIRSEVVVHHMDSPLGFLPHARPIPAVRRPPADPAPPEAPAPWDLSNLLYAVGLPVRGDDAPERTPALLKDEWRQLLQTDPSPNIKDDGLVSQWKGLARRTLIDEVDDGFPGLSLGAIPAASSRNTTFLGLHPSRAGSSGDMVRDVLGTLGSASMTLPDGRPIGTLWREAGTAVSATTNAVGYAIGARTITLAAAGTGRILSGDTITFAGDPNRYVVELGTESDVSIGATIELAAPGLRTALPASAVPIAMAPFRHRNTDFVVFISPLRGGRAANTRVLGRRSRYIALGCGDENVFPLRVVPGKPAFALDILAASSVEASVSRTLAHELGHSLGLGDEYVEVGEPFSEVGQRQFGNLQREDDAQIQDPADPTKRILHGDHIQWNWHRITAAAIVNGDITQVSGLDEFRIPVMPDVSFRFSVGDVLRLRVRPAGLPLQKLDWLDVSRDLIVIAPPEPDAIHVRADPAQAGIDKWFPPGSLLYRPKPAPRSVLSPLYPYAEMVAKNVKEAITDNKKALIDAPGPNDKLQWPIVDKDPATGRHAEVANPVIGADDLPRIVGLYPGGGRFASGIFHPTGQCMMRNSHDGHAEFCAVCRYVIVDLVAPEFHPEIDADYEKFYPQK
jgi:hypothetical protein